MAFNSRLICAILIHLIFKIVISKTKTQETLVYFNKDTLEFTRNLQQLREDFSQTKKEDNTLINNKNQAITIKISNEDRKDKGGNTNTTETIETVETVETAETLNTHTSLEQVMENTTQSSFFCLDEKDCNNHGKCLDNKECICDAYYITVPNSTNNTSQCNYELLSKQTFFVTAFFFGTLGVDYFYIGKIGMGILKLMLPLLFFMCGVLIYSIGKSKDSSKVMLTGKMTELFGTVMLIVIWIVNLAMILSNYYKDENEIGLYNDL